MNLFAPLLFSAGISAAAPAGFPAPDAPQPPVTEKISKDVSVHGDVRTDDYFWLRERDNPKVTELLKAENDYTEAVLKPQAALREKLFQEMLGRLKETDSSAPAPFLGWLYYTRTQKGLQHPIQCRKKDAPGAAEEVLVDVNALAEGKDFAQLGQFALNRTGTRLLYTMDWTGGRDYELFVKDLATGKLIPTTAGTVAAAEWAADEDTLYYTTEDDTKRAYQLYRTSLASGKKELLYEEKDEMFDLALHTSRDFAWVFCESSSKTTSEARAYKADNPQAAAVMIRPRETDHEYHVTHHEGKFLILTNKEAKNFRLAATPADAPGEWTELLAHRPAVHVSEADVFLDFIALQERENGLPQITLYDFKTGDTRRLAMPEQAYDLSPAVNLDYTAKEYRFQYESMITPPVTVAVNVSDGARRTVKEREVPGYDRTKYRTHRLFAAAADGTKIPLSVVHRADLDRTRPQPLHLYGYGSYGISETASFSSGEISLLDRGGIHVVAHVRGGGELGEEWREAGRMERKMTTFTDFVSCAEWLIKEGWTSPCQLVISGGSAGGMLMGAVVNLRPDLFRAAVLDVPFVDVLNTMLDDSLPLTTSEYVEWGNPNIKEQYGWMRAYSPYDNLKPAAYPHLLINTGLNDSQVPYWEGAKYAAKVRTLNTGKNLVLLHCDMSAGHGGVSGRYDAIREAARTRTFVLSVLGKTE